MRLHDISKLPGGSEGKVLDDGQLVRLRRVLLMMMDDLAAICARYDLKFLLIGGTGIGAVRHRGFIPWDDDVDIAMTRKDYDSLRRIIREHYSDRYELSDPRDHENYGKTIPKLRLNHTVYRTILDAENENPGIRIDIFVIENTYDCFWFRQIHGLGCCFFGFALSCRRLAAGWGEYRKLAVSASLRWKAFAGLFFSFASLQTWARWTDRWYARCRNDGSIYVSLPSDDPHFYGSLTKRADFCETRDAKFEGRIFQVPEEVHRYLTRQYGDYMKIPPEEKRVRGRYLEFDPGIYGDC